MTVTNACCYVGSRLDSNALVCDCELVWLVQMLKEQMKDTQTAASCQQPQDMQGKSLALMTDQDFHCRKHICINRA
jgi:peroxidase